MSWWGKDADKGTISPETTLIESVVLEAPSFLLENVDFVDPPGSGDANPSRAANLYAAVQKCDAIVVFSNKEDVTADKSLNDFLKSTLALRLSKEKLLDEQEDAAGKPLELVSRCVVV